MVLQTKATKNTMENGHIFQIILYRILITGGSGSGKTNTLLNLIKEQDNDNISDKIYLYAKDLSEPKHEFLIEKT